MSKYQPKSFEEKWTKVWEGEKIYQTPERVEKGKKQYVLSMFPYPSGDGLHVGHVRLYTGTDVMARFFRMNDYQVLHPMGWDAFGLPAENAAIKAKKNPMEMVPKNIENFKRQMKMLGFSYDWQSEFSTIDPEYYKWTQWLFIQFFKMGLLYKKEIPVYYCPFCKTGLAEEEVLPDGTHERCQKSITRKTLPQWVFAITKYADRLLSDLERLDWSEGILEMQRNWIGRSEGTEIKFKIESSNVEHLKNKTIDVFTTRADTLFGVTAVVVAPEHWLIEEILDSKFQTPNSKLEEIKKYVEEAKRKLDLARTDLAKEKTGVFTGVYVLHPLTNEKIPVWVADYVVGWYGEGAVMVVPAHDERDFDFAKKNDLPIKRVINPKFEILNSKQIQNTNDQIFKTKKNLKKAFTEYGILVNSGEFDGLTSEEAIKKITEKLEKLGLGRRKVTYKLRDWIFSRQRYWGEPIPMVYCESCAKKGISYSSLDNNSFKKIKVGVFIDDSNLFYGAKKSGWRIDLKKLKKYFENEFCHVIFMKYFVALPEEKDSAYKKSLSYLDKIKNIVEINTKPLKYIPTEKGIIKKGNVDVEITISALDTKDQYDVAIILSGDSDFFSLREKLLSIGKKVMFLAYKKNLSFELKSGKYLFIEKIREQIELNKKTTPQLRRGLLLKLLYKKESYLSRENEMVGWFPIPEEELPLKLPYVKSYEPTETGESPLSKIPQFVNTKCPNCGGLAKRETDTMPNWAGSCWYFLAFSFWKKEKNYQNAITAKAGIQENIDSRFHGNDNNVSLENSKLFRAWNLDFRNLIDEWLPVDWYLGGAEHAVLHLLYSRFWVKALYDLGLLSFKEPFLRLRNVGMVLAEDHRKMSKSFGNVINPDDVVAEYGADTLRLYEMFMAPFNQEIAWSTSALQGCYRFLKRVWEVYEKYNKKHKTIIEDKKLLIKLNKTIKKVTEDIKQLKFNTAIAAMMEFLNAWEKTWNLERRTLSIANAKKFLQILAPFAPFITEEIWRNVFHEKNSIHISSWPRGEENIEEEIILPIQVNGKVRGTIKMKHEILNMQHEVEKKALENEKIRKYLEGKQYKIIYVKGKIVNFVVL